MAAEPPSSPEHPRPGLADPCRAPGRGGRDRRHPGDCRPSLHAHLPFHGGRLVCDRALARAAARGIDGTQSGRGALQAGLDRLERGAVAYAGRADPSMGPSALGDAPCRAAGVGLSALAATIVWWPADRGGRLTSSALVACVPLVVMTIPGFAVDVARWGPQEPLQIGSMSLAAALLVTSLRSAIGGSRGRDQRLGLAVGVALWWLEYFRRRRPSPSSCLRRFSAHTFVATAPSGGG